MFKRSVLFASLIIFCLVLSANAAVMLDKIVAVVNSDVITWSELYRTMEMDASPQIKALDVDQRHEIFKKNEAQFLESLINQRLQLQEAENLGIRVSKREIEEAIDNIRRKYGISQDAFRRSLEMEGYTLDDYRKRLAEQIMVSKVVNSQIRSKIKVSDDDVRKFMGENRALLSDSEGYHIRQIFFAAKDDADRSKVQEKADLALKQIREGAAFSDVARSASEDASAASGGDLGMISKKDLAPEFLSVLSSMKPGDVSQPFWTAGGVHVILLEKKSTPKTPEELFEESSEMLMNRLFTDQYQLWIKSLREKSFIEIRE